MEKIVEQITEIKTAIKSDIDSIKSDVANIEKAVAEQAQLVKAAPDRKTIVRKAITEAWNGNKQAIKSLDAGYLSEDTVREILPAIDDGFDLLAVALVKTVKADSTNIGTSDYAGLGRGTETTSDFAAISVNVAMPLAWQYLGYSTQEFNNSNLSMADENVKAYFTNRKATLAKEFVDGTGSGELKGIETYATTTTFEAGKLQIKETEGVDAADIRAAIKAARNATKVGRKILVVNSDTLTLLEEDVDANGNSPVKIENGVLMFERCEVWVNDNMADAEVGEIAAVVFTAGRGYGVAVNPEIVVSSKEDGSKQYLYMGQGLGGAIVDNKAIVGIKIASVS